MHTVNATIGKDLYQTTLTAGTNTIIADEPLDLGGQDSGFNPKELLSASLASCTAITLKMYAQRKNWPVAEFFVEVSILENIETKHTEFQRVISYTGTLDESQAKRIEAIANACPIHKLLSSAISVSTTIEGN